MARVGSPIIPVRATTNIRFNVHPLPSLFRRDESRITLPCLTVALSAHLHVCLFTYVRYPYALWWGPVTPVTSLLSGGTWVVCVGSVYGKWTPSWNVNDNLRTVNNGSIFPQCDNTCECVSFSIIRSEAVGYEVFVGMRSGKAVALFQTILRSPCIFKFNVEICIRLHWTYFCCAISCSLTICTGNRLQYWGLLYFRVAKLRVSNAAWLTGLTTATFGQN